uniref:properdin-like n=1 Tax=Centroberyx gerrardi TaxID=166262 RepID=UPI003AAC1D74
GGWGPWQPWSSCSVSCGGGGVKRRERVCSSQPECRSTCSGSTEETESCSTHTACPVHGGWTSWSESAECSESCIQSGGVAYPTRTRVRSCSSPAPSSHTVPPGNGCPGDGNRSEVCTELPNCPVDGGWGAWLPPGPCSASCGEGLQLSVRKCDSPAPKYGGRLCEGPNAQASVCHSTCAGNTHTHTHTRNVTAPPPNMAASRVPEPRDKPASARPTSTVQ